MAKEVSASHRFIYEHPFNEFRPRRMPAARQYCRQSRIEPARGTDKKTIIQICFFLSIIRSPITIIIIIIIIILSPTTTTERRRLMDGELVCRCPLPTPIGRTVDALPPSIVSRSRQVVCLHRRVVVAHTRARARVRPRAPPPPFKTRTRGAHRRPLQHGSYLVVAS